MEGNDTPGAFRCAAILGLGLMGASLGLALRAAGVAALIVGYDADPTAAERALARGAVDAAASTAGTAVAGADLVVLAAPVLALRELLVAIAPHLAPDAVITDLGSTKVQVVAWAEALLPEPANFLGGHPMVGSERSGVEAADPALYRGGLWCLTPTPRTTRATVARLTALLERLAVRPVLLDAARHDAAAAAISHLPLLAATALALVAAERPDWDIAQVLAAGGFRDTTRVASGDARMARDICLTNAQPMLDCLDSYLAMLHALRDRLSARDAGIEETFATAKRARDAWLANH
jgi:prephenate dehydrogenase